jgi:hypothetical protein
MAMLAQAPSPIIAICSVMLRLSDGFTAMEHRIFASEDAAADYIAFIKTNDPNDRLSYVISAAPAGADQFVIDIFDRDGRWIGCVGATNA